VCVVTLDVRCAADSFSFPKSHTTCKALDMEFEQKTREKCAVLGCSGGGGAEEGVGIWKVLQVTDEPRCEEGCHRRGAHDCQK
jgi:hypothetical protein